MNAGLEAVNRTMFIGTSPTHPQHLTSMISLLFDSIVAMRQSC